MEIVAFLAKHPQFRPARLPQLAAAYYAALQWLEKDYQPNRHLLNAFAFGRGNYSCIRPARVSQQTTAFFGAGAGAQAWLMPALHDGHIGSFPVPPTLPELARFETLR